jgi:hypothetical protein
MFGQYSHQGGFHSTQGIHGVKRDVTGKVIKRVFKTGMVEHIWVQQTQEEGRNQKGSVYFKGPTLYSYCDSWPIATFLTPTLVVVNEEKCSATTSEQTRAARHSIKEGIDIVTTGATMRLRALLGDIYNVTPDTARTAIVQEQIDKLKLESRQLAKFTATNFRRMNWDGSRNEDNGEIRCAQLSDAEIKRVATLLRVEISPNAYSLADMRATIMTNYTAFTDPKAVAKREHNSLKRLSVTLEVNAHRYVYGDPRDGHHWIPHRTLETRKRAFDLMFTQLPETHWRPLYEAARIKLAASEIDATHKLLNPDAESILYDRQLRTDKKQLTVEEWQTGKNGNLPYDAGTWVRKRGDSLETSRHAECPWRHAELAFLKAQQCRMEDQPWHTNGHKLPVGHFTVDSIDADGTLHAGCHILAFDEMLRLAIRESPHLVKARFPLPIVISNFPK